VKPLRNCPLGGRPRWSAIWEPLPGDRWVRLECDLFPCADCDLDCCTEYFKDTAKGRQAAIIEWNRKNCKKRIK
jgi:hypothetical protein